MDRRTILRRSATVSLGVLAAGCSGGDGGNGGDGTDRGTPTDLLGSGAVEIGGISTENPTDEQGTVEYYRAVAGITNLGGADIPYLNGTMEFRDADDSVLETATGALVGFPAEMHWAFDAEYGGGQPGDVASVAVPTVRGFTTPEPEDYRETGDVGLRDVERSVDKATNRVVVTGDVTNESGSTLDVVQVFANLWVAQDRVLATVTDRTEGLDDGETWAFEGSHRFSPHATSLLPIVTEENDLTIPYVTGATAFELSSDG